MARKRILLEEGILVNKNKKGQQNTTTTTTLAWPSSSSWRFIRRWVRLLVPAILLLAFVCVHRWNNHNTIILPHSHHQHLKNVGEAGTTPAFSETSRRSATRSTEVVQSQQEYRELPTKEKDRDENLNEEVPNGTGKFKPTITQSGGTVHDINIDDDRQRAYQFALDRALARSKNKRQPLAANLETLWQQKQNQHGQQQQLQQLQPPILLHLIRIPKAGSSALSVTARALAGCKPDGFPCCRNPKTNKACPLANLDCPKIRGCTDHRPNYSNYTTTATTEKVQPEIPFVVPMITSLRNPVSRAVSAFFYEPPHRPPGACFSFECFERDFIKRARYQNPSTKMLAGHYAYAQTPPRTYPINVAKRRLCDMAWFGIAEWGVASSLLLYESHPFTMLQPNPVAFGLPPHSSVVANDTTSAATVGLRENINEHYTEFKNGVFVQRNGTGLIHTLHNHDVEVYHFAVQLFCARVQEAPGFQAAVQEVQLLHHFKGCNDLWNVNNSSSSSSSKSETRQLCGVF